MKDSWERVKLGEFLKLQGGFAFASTMFQESGIPLIRISNISSSGIHRDFVYLPNVFEKFHSEFSLNEDDILIAMSGATTGKNCKITSKHLPALLNQRTGRFQIQNKEVLDNDYLYYVVNSDNFRTNLLIDAIGGAQPNISSKQIENLSINLPPLPQQRKIAKILNTVDAVIEKTEAAIAKYQQLKQGLMQDVFTRGIDVRTGQLRPKQEDAPDFYQKSELGLIPKEWEIEKAINLYSLYNGRAYSITEWEDKGTPVIRLQNLTGSGEKFYYSTLKLPDFQYCEKGDLLYMWSATFGTYVWDGPRAIYHYHIWKVECNDEVFDKNFAKIELDRFTDIVRKTSQGSTMAHITKGGMEERLIGVPSVQEQTLIAQKLQSIDQKIHTEQRALAKYQQLKAGLMQDLLTGEVSV